MTPASTHMSAGPAPTFKSLMIFIDGGYLRGGFKKVVGHDNIDFGKLGTFLTRYSVPRGFRGYVRLDAIRAYYYDGIVDPLKHPRLHKQERKYFEKIEKYEYYEVKLGRHIKTPKRDEQKGVDVKITIDMITKAYQNHYNFAVLLAGDDDLVDAVKTVKDIAGKRVVGAAFEWNLSPRLKKVFDTYINLDAVNLKDLELHPLSVDPK